MILVERIGHIALVLIDWDDLENLFGEIAQRLLAWRAHNTPKCDITHRVHSRINQNDMIKLLWQVFG